MNDGKDNGHNLVLKAVNVLLLKNPERTVLGGVLGLALSFLFKLFSPVLSSVTIIDTQGLSDCGWMALGVAILNLPIIFNKVSNRPKINDEVDSVISIIEQGNFSEPEKRRMYRELVTNLLSTVSLKTSLRKQQIKLQDEFEKDAE